MHLLMVVLSEGHNEGTVGAFTIVEPRRSSHRLPVLSWIFRFSALGLLPVLLDSEPNEAFCRTPVGEDSNWQPESQPSLNKFSDDDDEQFLLWFLGVWLVLVRTSPRGPAMEASQETGFQQTCWWHTSFSKPTPRPVLTRSYSLDNLRGESGSLS